MRFDQLIFRMTYVGWKYYMNSRFEANDWKRNPNPLLEQTNPRISGSHNFYNLTVRIEYVIDMSK